MYVHFQRKIRKSIAVNLNLIRIGAYFDIFDYENKEYLQIKGRVSGEKAKDLKIQ